MNKLQLYITKSYRGFKSLVNFNPTEDVRRLVVDIRDAVSRVNYDPNEKNIFYLVKYTGKGTFLIVIRTIPVQPVDHLAAWVYVPNGLQITAEELSSVLKTTQRKISQQGVGEEDLAHLREIFSKEYGLDRQAAAIPSSLPGDKFAYCNYGTGAHYNFDDYLASGLFHPVFASYSGVLFIDAELGLTANATDLSSTELTHIVTILPPDRSKTDFVPYIYGVPFDHPFKAALNRNLNIVWKRTGFESTTQTVTVDRDNYQPQGISTVSQQKYITPASFYITSQQSHDPIANPQIEVNGVRITQEGHMFTESELKSASVTIKSDGYESYSTTLDLASITKALIKLQDKGRVYRFEIPLKSAEFGGPLRLSLHTKHPLDESPIEGYEALDTIQEGQSKMNHLSYVAPKKSAGWLGMLVSGLIGLGVGALVMMFFQMDKDAQNSGESVTQEIEVSEAEVAQDVAQEVAQESADKPAQELNAEAKASEQLQQSGSTEAQGAAATATDSKKNQQDSKELTAKAIQYLDGNPTWKKADMESYPALQGLWDDMNNMKLDIIINQWGPKLNGSKNFEQVVKAAKQSKSKKKDVHREGRTVYTKQDQIRWLHYTWWIDP